MTEREFSAALELRRQGRLDEAVQAWQRIVEQDPKLVPAQFNLGNALAALGRHAEAEAAFRAVLGLAPQDAEAAASLAVALRAQGRHAEAAEAFARAVALQPGQPELENDLANARYALGRVDEAVAGLRRALQNSPEQASVHYNLALFLLAQGRFEEGWRENRWRVRCDWFEGGVPAAPLAGQWEESFRGAPFNLVGEQGLGDELFFLRFAERLKALGAGPLALRVDPRLEPMLSRAGWSVKPLAGARELRLGDLPWFVRFAQADAIPPSIALRAKEDERKRMRERLYKLGPPPYLGVIWRAGTPGRAGRLYKELPPRELAAALRKVPRTVVILQRGARPGEVEAFNAALGRRAHDLGRETGNLERLLALHSLLDDYAGVSSTDVHLRATLGLTAQILVPMPPDWRWMASGDASPWHPGFGVYRQAVDRSWRDALARLARALG